MFTVHVFRRHDFRKTLCDSFSEETKKTSLSERRRYFTVYSVNSKQNAVLSRAGARKNASNEAQTYLKKTDIFVSSLDGQTVEVRIFLRRYQISCRRPRHCRRAPPHCLPAPEVTYSEVKGFYFYRPHKTAQWSVNKIHI